MACDLHKHTVTDYYLRNIVPCIALAALMTLISAGPLGLKPAMADTCASVLNLIDVNCNSELKIVFIGDSIVRGIGDTLNAGHGGYPKRIQAFYPEAKIRSFGYPGISTHGLLRKLKKYVRTGQNSELQIALNDADLIFIHVGTNDYYEEPDPLVGGPLLAVTNIRRMVAHLKYNLGIAGQSKPAIFVSNLLPTTRSFQRSFVAGVNRYLALQLSSAVPAYLNFKTLKVRYIGGDGLHPNSVGYTALAVRVKAFIETTAQRMIARGFAGRRRL